MVLLTAPLISACVIPFLLLDLSITIYQSVCFPIYRIPKVRRRDFLIFDRRHLAYLNAKDKIGCVYCSYPNGLVAYVGRANGTAILSNQACVSARRYHTLDIDTSRRMETLEPIGTRSAAVARSYGDVMNGSK